MKPSRFSEEQIIVILREQDAGAKTADVCREHGVSSATLRGSMRGWWMSERRQPALPAIVRPSQPLKAALTASRKLTFGRQSTAGVCHRRTPRRKEGRFIQNIDDDQTCIKRNLRHLQCLRKVLMRSCLAAKRWSRQFRGTAGE